MAGEAHAGGTSPLEREPSGARILHVLHNSLPLVCGYSIRSGHIVRHQRRGGRHLLVVTSAQHPNGASMRESIDGVEHRRTPAYRGPQWPLWREWELMRRLEVEILSAVRDFRPDVIHAHSPVLVGRPAQRVARRHRIPLVYEVRDLWENALVDRGRFGSESLLYKLARQAESRLLRRADAVVTICDTLRRELEPRVGRTDDVYVVPNGVDVEAFTPRPPSEEVRRRYRLEGKKVLLYVGTFQPYEGLGLLVQAFAQVLARVPQAHLLIAGGSTSLAYQGATTKGTQEELLGGLVSTLGLHGHVTMTGRIPHDEVAGLYTIGDCVIYPRVLTRTTSLTTPLKPLEAMAMGRAVLVSDVPPMKELVREGETGVTFAAGSPTALAERCLELLRDPQRRERLGRAARAYVVSERQWPRLISRYGAVYDSVRGAPERGH